MFCSEPGLQASGHIDCELAQFTVTIA